ncbi:hypothetical protein VC83_04685 [Pseudogymnoascus destructans]|uniref:Uncharacterized protein n=2 Tax=Pseudogymnoascus destructans TaxID=655981 RepID=L8FTG8_PSED2|nr:uncharacterized protein VC83_04685 [Pseudogymnoascus destructans]ELR03859.1 hypothetical protein GMDG_01388 [Pseudogymnoascus destructans 20631-21]OAF57557.1 hypothetical protein VC83_04685 [Pseudogymnoascus destructans]
MGDDRVAHWIETRTNRFKASFIPHDNHSSSYRNESNGGISTPPNSSTSSVSSGIAEDETADDLLQGCQNDPVIPSAEDIERTFRRGESQWRECLGLAERQQTLRMPESPGVLRLTEGVPPLPSQLRGLKEIGGYPTWEFLHAESDDMGSMDDVFTETLDDSDPTWQPTSPPEVDEWSMDLARGNEKILTLSIPKPTRYRLTEECNSNSDASPASPSNGITILIQCLSYYFCAKLLEMQERKSQVYFSGTFNTPCRLLRE